MQLGMQAGARLLRLLLVDALCVCGMVLSILLF
jgi:hypothetical protein